MIRILVADDERDERDVVRFLLEKFGFEMEFHEAENGRDALAWLQGHPADILLTDVRMPFLSGTELAEKTRELHPEMEILFFSGYDDFSYVRGALTVGAVDYILKPIHPEEFQKTMEKAILRVREHAQEKQEREQAVSFRKSHILTRLLGGANLEALEREYGRLPFLNSFRRVLLLQFDHPLFDRPPARDALALETAIKKALVGCRHHFLNLNPCQGLVLLEDTPGGEPDIGRTLAARLQQSLSAAAGQPCYVSISDPVDAPEELSGAYAQAEQAMEDRFFYTDICLYPVENADGQWNSPQENSRQDDALLQSLGAAVRDRDVYGLRRSTEILFSKYAPHKELSQIYIRYIFSQAAEILCRALPDGTDAQRQEAVERVYLCRSFSEIRGLVSGLVERAADQLGEGKDSPRHAVQIVRRYIQEHYGEELSLELLAGKCYLSPRYLSDLFIRETGCGINKYIKNLRMERARGQLLKTNRKIQEICREVGYVNFSYFCRSFREAYGMSPETYRQAPRSAEPVEMEGGEC